MNEIFNQLFVSLDDSIENTLKYYREKYMLLNKTITYEKNNKIYVKRVAEINNNGNLVVCDENGNTEIISSGEIRIAHNMY